MKPRNKYLYSSNSFYHIYNRGNNKRLIFFNSKDYIRFEQTIYKYEKDFDLNIYASCLMPNHYHLLIQLGSDTSAISKYMQRCMTSYVMYFNKKYAFIGRLFQSPFQVRRLPSVKSIIRVIQYIEKNPVEANLVKVSTDYRWLRIPLGQGFENARN
jgi:REP element-mobilizing transposase RayT